MIKRNFLIWFLALGLLFPLSSNATGQQIDWLPVNNCLWLASNMSNLLQDPSLVESPALPFDESTVIDDWVLQEYSSSFFVDYNGKERLITVLMWPKEPKWSTVDFKYAKKIWKIKLPVGFTNVRTRIFDDRYLIIFTEHYDFDRRVETVALFYDISEWKITPHYYFTLTWKLIKLHEQNWKLFVITNLPVDKNTIQTFIKKDWNLPWMFPKFVEWVKYWLNPNETVSVCRDFRYLQMPSNQMPSFWSVLVLNLNNLRISKDILYLFGTISQFEFTEKSMYTTVPWDWWSTIVQKFWIDPKINLQKSVLIDVPVLNGGIYAKDMRLAYIIERSSWKVNQYSLLPFDSTFSPSTEKNLYTSEETFSDVEFHGDSVVLKNRDKLVEIWELSNGGVSTHAWIELPLKDHNYFLFWANPLSLIDFYTANSQLSFSVIAMDKAQWKFKVVSKSKYPWEWSLIWPTSRNAKTRTLLVPVKMWWESAFEWLKWLQFTTKWAVSEIMARSYWESTLVETVKQLQNYSFSVTNKLTDLFLPNNTISKKVFSR